MNDTQLSQLILYIVDRVGELGGYTTTIRLVKFLYLIDLEHQRRHGRPLTGLRWVYHLYGPYAFEVPRLGALGGIDLEEEEFRSQKGHKGVLLRTLSPQGFPAGLSFAVENLVNGILEIWADQDTADLLTYVYRTEPMRQAKRGDQLDFSVTPRGTRYYELYVPIDRAEARKLREAAASYGPRSLEEYVEPSTRDDDALLVEGLRELADDELLLPDVTGFELTADPDDLAAVLGFDED